MNSTTESNTKKSSEDNVIKTVEKATGQSSDAVDLNNNSATKEQTVINNLILDVDKKLSLNDNQKEILETKEVSNCNEDDKNSYKTDENAATDDNNDKLDREEDDANNDEQDQELLQQMSSHGVAGSINDPGKMFIGGLSGNTTPENLKKYFEQFGTVSECMIMKDAITKRSRLAIFIEKLFLIILIVLLYNRGFGFITFSNADSVDKVLEISKHILDEKTVIF
jgi:RNA recognition motif-containing protein